MQKVIGGNMEEKTVYKSEWGRLLGFGLACGAAVCAAVYTLLYFGGIFIGALAWLSIRKAAAAVCVGVIAAVLTVLLRRTSVEMGSDYVVVKRAGVNVRCSADDRIVIKSDISTSTVEMLKMTTYKCGLVLDGRYVRLYGFSEKSFELLADGIRCMKSENRPLEEKILAETQTLYEPKVLLSADGLDGEYGISRDKIISGEKKLVGKIAVIGIACAAVLILIGLDGGGFKEAAALIIAVCMVISCPFMLIGCFKRAKFFPEKIEISGEHLYVGDEHFTLTSIDYAKLTSPRKKSDSIYPVQYYLKIRDGGKVHKYWLGSSLLCQNYYGNFCDSMSRAFAMYPKKLIIK